MKVRSFSHTGITVSNFNRAVQFYWDVFKCPLVGVSDTAPERIRDFFEVDSDKPTLKIGWIRIPGGAVIEIFEFEPQEKPTNVRWNRVGLTHICFNVRGIQKWYDHLKDKGVECLSPPERSPRGHTLFLAKDPDGNLIEITDLGYMYPVLRWLAPLGGLIFRRGMYKHYYDTSSV